jgi:molecular chaperone HscB
MDAMNYFELFGIPVTLNPDPKKLRSRFIELSREFHPDFHMQADNAAKSGMLEKSAQINKAWKTFQDQDATIRYVLMSKGLMAEEEKYELPPDFLMQVLEINEQVMDGAANDPALSGVLEEIQKEIYDPVHGIIENYSEAVHTEKELLQVKEYYYKKRYLDRIKRELAGGTV